MGDGRWETGWEDRKDDETKKVFKIGNGTNGTFFSFVFVCTVCVCVLCVCVCVCVSAKKDV